MQIKNPAHLSGLFYALSYLPFPPPCTFGPMARFSSSYNDIDKMAEDWARDVHEQLLTSMQKKKASFSGELQNSLQVQVHHGSDGWPRITISFANYGRFIDMKSLYYSKHPPIDVLKDWVLRTGIGKFKYIPGYQGRNLTPTREQAASRIAWGIATSKRYGGVSNQYGKNTRRKVWKQKTLGTAIGHLNRLVAETVANTSKDMIVQAFQKTA